MPDDESLGTIHETVSEKAPSEGNSSQVAVSAWLANHGVILEMKVASDFRRYLPQSIDTTVTHGRMYLDEDLEEKLRESDIVVHVNKHFGVNSILTLWLIIECKSSVKGQWVFYRSDERTPYSQTYDNLFVSKTNQDFNFSNLGGMRSIPIFNVENQPFSYSVITAFTGENEGKDQRNPARDAILQVLSAAKGVGLDSILPEDRQSAVLFLPIVITRADMFSVELLENGEIRVEPTNRELVINRYKSLDGTLDAIWVIHESQIENVIREFSEGLGYLFYR